LWDVFQAGGASQIHRYIDQRHRQLGPIFREKLGHVNAVWLSDTGLYKQVYQHEGKCPQVMLPKPWTIFNEKHRYERGLFFMQGDEWSHYRRILSPLLLKIPTLHRHIDSFDCVADQLVDRWKANKDGLINNLEQELYLYFVQGLMCAMFGKEIGLDGSYLNSIPEMVANLQKQFQQSGQMTLFPPGMAAKLGLPVWNRFEESALNSLNIANRLTNACLEKMQNHPDDCIVGSLQQQNVSRYDIQRIITDLFIAASDTTSHSMQWILYTLANHLEVQEQIVEEIAASPEETTDIDRWQHVPTLKGAVKEALRLYPVATFLTRVVPNKCIIGNYRIPAQTLALLSVYSSGRSEKYFPNPEVFLPERWSRSNSGVQDPYGSLPFGHGKRACVGRRLAETQMYILLYKALPKLVFRPENQVQMIMRLIGTVDQPLRLRCVPR